MWQVSDDICFSMVNDILRIIWSTNLQHTVMDVFSKFQLVILDLFRKQARVFSVKSSGTIPVSNELLYRTVSEVSFRIHENKTLSASDAV